MEVKDSSFQSHILKYKYGMRPLTVTWSPYVYKHWMENFRNWIDIGGFDNYLFTPNGKVHRYLTKRALINILHPFQPFILGQKVLLLRWHINLIYLLFFYGETPSDYGTELVTKKNFPQILRIASRFYNESSWFN